MAKPRLWLKTAVLLCLAAVCHAQDACRELETKFHNYTEQVNSTSSVLERFSEVICLGRSLMKFLERISIPEFMLTQRKFDVLNMSAKAMAQIQIRGKMHTLNMTKCELRQDLIAYAPQALTRIIKLFEEEIQILRDLNSPECKEYGGVVYEWLHLMTQKYKNMVQFHKRVYGLLTKKYQVKCLQIWRKVIHNPELLPEDRVANARRIECLSYEVQRRIDLYEDDKLLQTVDQAMRLRGMGFEKNRTQRRFGERRISGSKLRVNLSSCEEFKDEEFHNKSVDYLNASLHDRLEDLEILRKIDEEFRDCFEDVDSWWFEYKRDTRAEAEMFKHLLYILQNNKTDKCTPMWGIRNSSMNNDTSRDGIQDHHKKPDDLNCLGHLVQEMYNRTNDPMLGSVVKVVMFSKFDDNVLKEDDYPPKIDPPVHGRMTMPMTIPPKMLFKRPPLTPPANHQVKEETLNVSLCKDFGQSKDELIRHANEILQREIEKSERIAKVKALMLRNFSDCIEEGDDLKINKELADVEGKINLMKAALKVMKSNITDKCDLVKLLQPELSDVPSMSTVYRRRRLGCAMHDLEQRIMKNIDSVYESVEAAMELQGFKFGKNDSFSDDNMDSFDPQDCEDTKQTFRDFEKDIIGVLKYEIGALMGEKMMMKTLRKEYSPCVDSLKKTSEQDMLKRIKLYETIIEVLHNQYGDKCALIHNLLPREKDRKDGVIELKKTLCILENISNKTRNASKLVHNVKTAFRFLLHQRRDNKASNGDFLRSNMSSFCNDSHGIAEDRVFDVSINLMQMKLQSMSQELIARNAIARNYKTCMPYDDNWGFGKVKKVAENVAKLKKVINVLLSNDTDICVNAWSILPRMNPDERRVNQTRRPKINCFLSNLSNRLGLDKRQFSINKIDIANSIKVSPGKDDMDEFYLDFEIFDDFNQDEKFEARKDDCSREDDKDKRNDDYYNDEKDNNDGRGMKKPSADDDGVGEKEHGHMLMVKQNFIQKSLSKLEDVEAEIADELNVLHNVSGEQSRCFPYQWMKNEIVKRKLKHMAVEKMISYLKNMTDKCQNVWLDLPKHLTNDSAKYTDNEREITCLRRQMGSMVKNDGDGFFTPSITTKLREHEIGPNDYEDDGLNVTSCADDISIAMFLNKTQGTFQNSFANEKRRLDFLRKIQSNYSECFAVESEWVKDRITLLEGKMEMFRNFLDVANSRKENCSTIWKKHPINVKDVKLAKIVSRMSLECFFKELQARAKTKMDDKLYANLIMALQIRGFNILKEDFNGTKSVKIQGLEYELDLSRCNPIPIQGQKFIDYSISLLNATIAEMQNEAKALEEISDAEKACFRNAQRMIEHRQRVSNEELQVLETMVDVFTFNRSNNASDNCIAVRGLIPSNPSKLRIKKELDFKCLEQEMMKKLRNSNGFYRDLNITRQSLIEQSKRPGSPFEELNKIRENPDSIRHCNDEGNMRDFVDGFEEILRSLLHDTKKDLRALVIIANNFTHCVNGSDQWKMRLIPDVQRRVKQYEDMVKLLEAKKGSCRDLWKMVPHEEDEIPQRSIDVRRNFECVGRLFKKVKERDLEYKKGEVFFGDRFEKPLDEMKAVKIRGKTVEINMKSCKIDLVERRDEFLKYSGMVVQNYVKELKRDIVFLRRLKDQKSDCFDDLVDWVDSAVEDMQKDVFLYTPFLGHLNKTRDCIVWQKKVENVPKHRNESQSKLICLLRQVFYKAKHDKSSRLSGILTKALNSMGFRDAGSLQDPAEGSYYRKKIPLDMSECREPERVMEYFVVRALKIISVRLMEIAVDAKDMANIMTHHAHCFVDTLRWMPKLLMNLNWEVQVHTRIIEILTKVPGRCAKLWKEVPKSARDISRDIVENQRLLRCFMRAIEKRLLHNQDDDLSAFIKEILIESGENMNDKGEDKLLEKDINGVRVTLDMEFCDNNKKDRSRSDMIKQAEHIFHKLLQEELKQLERVRLIKDNFTECFVDDDEPDRKLRAVDNKVKAYKKILQALKEHREKCHLAWKLRPQKREDILKTKVHNRTKFECDLRRLWQRMKNDTSKDNQFGNVKKFAKEKGMNIDEVGPKKIDMDGLEIDLDMSSCRESGEPREEFLGKLVKDLRRNIDQMTEEADMAYNLTENYGECFGSEDGVLRKDAEGLYEKVEEYEVLLQILSRNSSDECIFIHGMLPKRPHDISKSRIKNSVDMKCLQRLIIQKYDNRNGSFSLNITRKFHSMSDRKPPKDPSYLDIMGVKIRSEMSACGEKKESDEGFFKAAEHTLRQAKTDLMRDLDTMEFVLKNYSQCTNNTEKWRNTTIPAMRKLINLYAETADNMRNKSRFCDRIWRMYPSRVSDIPPEKLKTRYKAKCFSRLVHELSDDSAINEDMRYPLKVLDKSIGKSRSGNNKARFGRVDINLNMDSCKLEEKDPSQFIDKWLPVIKEYLKNSTDELDDLLSIVDDDRDCFEDADWIKRDQEGISYELTKYKKIFGSMNKTASCFDLLRDSKKQQSNISSERITAMRDYVCAGRQLRYKASVENEPFAKILLKFLLDKKIHIADDLYSYGEADIDGVKVDLQMSRCKEPEKSMEDFRVRSDGLIRNQLRELEGTRSKLDLIERKYKHCYRDVDQWLGPYIARIQYENATFVELLELMDTLPAKCNDSWAKIPKDRDDIPLEEIGKKRDQTCLMRQIKHRMKSGSKFSGEVVDMILKKGGKFDDKKFADRIKGEFDGIEREIDMSDCREKGGHLSEFMDHISEMMNKTVGVMKEKRRFLSSIDNDTARCFPRQGHWYRDDMDDLDTELDLYKDVADLIKNRKRKCSDIWQKMPKSEKDVPKNIVDNQKTVKCLGRQLALKLVQGERNPLIQSIGKTLILRGVKLNARKLDEEDHDRFYGFDVQMDFSFCNESTDPIDVFAVATMQALNRTISDMKKEIEVLEEVEGEMFDCLEMKADVLRGSLQELRNRLDLYKTLVFIISNNRTDQCVEIEGLLPKHPSDISPARVKTEVDFMCLLRQLKELKDFDRNSFYEELVEKSGVNFENKGDNGTIEISGQRLVVNMSSCQLKKESRQDFLKKLIKYFEDHLKNLREDHKRLLLVVTNYSSCVGGSLQNAQARLQNLTAEIKHLQRNIDVFMRHYRQCSAIWMRVPKDRNGISGEILSNVQDTICLMRRLKVKVKGKNDALLRSLAANARLSLEKKDINDNGKAKIFTVPLELNMASCRDESDSQEKFLKEAKNTVKKYTEYMDLEISLFENITDNYPDCFDNFDKDITREMELKKRQKEMYENFLELAKGTEKCFEVVKRIPTSSDDVSDVVTSRRADLECLMRQVKYKSDRNESDVAEALLQEWENNMSPLVVQDMDAFYKTKIRHFELGITMGKCQPIVETRAKFIARALRVLTNVMPDLEADRDLMREIFTNHTACFEDSDDWVEDELDDLRELIDIYKQFVYILRNWPKQTKCEKAIDEVRTFRARDLPSPIAEAASEFICVSQFFKRYAKIQFRKPKVSLITKRLEYAGRKLADLPKSGPVNMLIRGLTRKIGCGNTIKITDVNVMAIGDTVLRKVLALLEGDQSYLAPILKEFMPCFMENKWFFDMMKTYANDINLITDLIKILEGNITHVCPKGSKPNKCDVCVGGDTGVPTTQFIDRCGVCTNKVPYKVTWDCNDECGGTAYLDRCSNVCVGGSTTEDADDYKHMKDCAGKCNGSRILDDCRNCVDKNVLLKYIYGSKFKDCNGDCYAPKYKKQMAVRSTKTCNKCIGGKSGLALSDVITVCGDCAPHPLTCRDCNGVANGKAKLDSCGTCGGDGTSCETLASVTPTAIPAGIPTEVTVLGGGLRGKVCGVKQAANVVTTSRRSSIDDDTIALCSLNLTNGTYRVTLGSNGVWLNATLTVLQVYSPKDLVILNWSVSEVDSGLRLPFAINVTGVGFDQYKPPLCKVQIKGSNQVTFVKAKQTTDPNILTCALPSLPKKSASLLFSLSLSETLSLEPSHKVVFYAPAPNVTKTQFSQNGRRLTVSFSGPIQLVNKTRDCSVVFTTATAAKLGSRAKCFVVARKNLVISLWRSSTIEVGDSVTFEDNVVSARNEDYPRFIDVGPYTVSGPDISPSPVAKIVGHTALSSCNDLRLRSVSTGSYGRRLTHHWSCQTAGNEDIAINALLNATQGSRRIQIPSQSLQSGVNYTFTLNVTNFFRMSHEQSVVVTKSAAMAPTLDLGVAAMTVKRNQRVFIKARVGIPKCVRDQTRASIVYEWTFDTPPATLPVVMDKRVLRIEPFTLSSGKTAVVTAKVNPQNQPSMSAVASVSITVVPQSLVPLIKGSRVRAIGVDAGIFTLDGRASHDPDRASGDMEYEWSCSVLNSDDGDPACYSNKPGKETTLNFGLIRLEATAKVSLDALELVPDTHYEFKLIVRKDNRDAETAVIVEAVAGQPPEVRMRRLVKAEMYERTGFLAVTAIIKSTTSIQNVEWTTADLDGHEYMNLTDDSNLLKPPVFKEIHRSKQARKKYIAQIFIRVDEIVRDVDYAFKVTVTDSSGATVTDTSMSTRRLPNIEDCEVLVQPYTVGDTINIEVDNCVGDPLSYRYFTLDARNRRKPLSSGITTESQISTIGPSDNGAGVKIFGVKVCNEYSICSTFLSDPVNVTTIVSLTSNQENAILDLISSFKQESNFMDALIYLTNLEGIRRGNGASGRRRRSVDDTPDNTTTELLDLATSILDSQVQSVDGLIVTLKDIGVDKMTSDQRGDFVAIYERILATFKSDGTDLSSQELVVILQKLIELEEEGVSRETTSSVRDQALAALSNSPPAQGASTIYKDDVSSRFIVATAYQLLDTTFVVADNVTGDSFQINFNSDLADTYTDWDCGSADLSNCQGAVIKTIKYAQEANVFPSTLKMSADPVDIQLFHPITNVRLTVTGLTAPIEILFETSPPLPDFRLICAYWDAANSAWVTTGLVTEVIHATSTRCKTTHLTAFTVLEEPAPPTVTKKPIGVASNNNIAIIVGATVGGVVFIAAIAVIVYFVVRKNKNAKIASSEKPCNYSHPVTAIGAPPVYRTNPGTSRSAALPTVAYSDTETSVVTPVMPEAMTSDALVKGV